VPVDSGVEWRCTCAFLYQCYYYKACDVCVYSVLLRITKESEGLSFFYCHQVKARYLDVDLTEATKKLFDAPNPINFLYMEIELDIRI
jgi:hypothetical protein